MVVFDEDWMYFAATHTGTIYEKKRMWEKLWNNGTVPVAKLWREIQQNSCKMDELYPLVERTPLYQGEDREKTYPSDWFKPGKEDLTSIDILSSDATTFLKRKTAGKNPMLVGYCNKKRNVCHEKIWMFNPINKFNTSHGDISVAKALSKSGLGFIDSKGNWNMPKVKEIENDYDREMCHVNKGTIVNGGNYELCLFKPKCKKKKYSDDTPTYKDAIFNYLELEQKKLDDKNVLTDNEAEIYKRIALTLGGKYFGP